MLPRKVAICMLAKLRQGYTHTHTHTHTHFAKEDHKEMNILLFERSLYSLCAMGTNYLEYNLILKSVT